MHAKAFTKNEMFDYVKYIVEEADEWLLNVIYSSD